jgi:hypothetical protein
MPRGGGVVRLREARPGVAVRVKDGLWRSEFGGMLGTVEHMWGHPDHPALDVRLEDGRSELFWFHELEKVQEEARTA